jgi:hypothetical protein
MYAFRSFATKPLTLFSERMKNEELRSDLPMLGYSLFTTSVGKAAKEGASQKTCQGRIHSLSSG